MFFVTSQDLLSEELKVFHPCFNKPQWKHFQTYLWGLILGEKGEKNVMDIAANALDGKEQSSLNRFLTGGSWDVSRLERRRLANFLPRKIGGALILDDTILEKCGKSMEAVDWLYNPTKGKSVLAHNIVTTFYSNEQVQVPLHLAPYLKAELCEEKDWHFKTKHQLAIELLRTAMIYVQPDVVIFDSWYFSKELVEVLNMSGQSWVTQPKSNRMVQVGNDWISVAELFNRIPHDAYKRISTEIEEKRYRWYTETVLSMKKVGLVKLVLLKNRKNGRKYRVLVSNDMTLSGEDIIKYYKKRWDIEVFYRDCKQHLGLGDYQVRGLEAVVIHLQIVFLAYTLLKNCRSPGILSILKGIRAIGSVCQRLKRWMFDYIRGLMKPKIKASLG